MLPDAISPSRLRRALVIKLRHHGDVLLASPVFSVLKRAAPDCEIDALVYVDTASMLEHHPAISQIHHIDRNWKHLGRTAQIGAEWRLLKTLRARGYDLVIHLTEHRRGAWLTRLLRPHWSVAPRQRSNFWRSSFTHLTPWASHPRRHTVETHLDALRRLGIQPVEDDKRLVLVPGIAAETRVAALLDEKGLRERAFVHLHPGSRWPFKCWPTEKVAQLADALSARDLTIVLTAAPSAQEFALVDALRKSMQTSVVDLSGQLSLRELAVLTSKAKLFIGVDSAPMHIAAAMGTPVVTLFGPSGDIEWGPWRVKHRIIVSDAHPCRPCGLDGCGGGKISECLTALSVEQVLAACVELL
ncbi:MAG: putative lipopolysaccharide heptosyltransferase III [Zoogloeaceae bacterium]|jgi:heptosyltransferase-3|nr:putative lipopolysaccharide heptosyltransferase III [Zoogloeaceae bacterium]